MTTPGDLLLMGRCGRAHGVLGEVKVHPETDDPGRFEALEKVYLGPTATEAQAYEVEGVRYQFPRGSTVVLLALVGVDSREAAEALVHLRVYASEAALPPLADDEVYYHDLVGLDVVEVDDEGDPIGDPLGVVREVRDEGAQVLFAVARPGRPDALVPDVPEIVVGVDTEGRRLFVRPPEGLFE